MNVFCPNCNTLYRVDPAKVPEDGVRARCAVCSAVFAVRRDGAAAVSEQVRAPEPPLPPAPEPPSPPPSPPPPSAPPPVVERPVVPAPPPASPRPAAARVAPAGLAMPSRGPGLPPPAMPSTSGGRAGPAGRPVPPAVRPAAPARSLAAAMPPTAPPPTAPPPAAPPVEETPEVSPPALASGPPAAQPPSASGPAARPINPFLSQDPAAKARRLARALISDMVVYHPAKRQEGLREGTLKDLFDEEIRKSWEEYAEQVGKDLADSTSYFREALNEILADGRQIF
jgi:predicted Zn finger-like uncharacterized protein